MVRILVDYGTSVDTQNGEGQTALHIAAAEGDEALVKYFYSVRASASIVDNDGEFFLLPLLHNVEFNINTKMYVEKIERQCIWQLRMDMLQLLNYWLTNFVQVFMKGRKMEIH